MLFIFIIKKIQSKKMPDYKVEGVIYVQISCLFMQNGNNVKGKLVNIV